MDEFKCASCGEPLLNFGEWKYETFPPGSMYESRSTRFVECANPKCKAFYVDVRTQLKPLEYISITITL